MPTADLTFTQGGPHPPGLSMRETLACIDADGRCRCPWCGRYASLDAMTRTPAAYAPGVRVSLAPRCARCVEAHHAR